MDEKIGSEARVMSDRSKVFISYSHKDAKHLKRLRIYLADYERIGLVDIWDDTRLIGGEDWQQEIKKAIQSAKVAVLLISADFLASDFMKGPPDTPTIHLGVRRPNVVLLEI